LTCERARHASAEQMPEVERDTEINRPGEIDTLSENGFDYRNGAGVKGDNASTEGDVADGTVA
jgi:hypothetical protein